MQALEFTVFEIGEKTEFVYCCDETQLGNLESFLRKTSRSLFKLVVQDRFVPEFILAIYEFRNTPAAVDSVLADIESLGKIS